MSVQVPSPKANSLVALTLSYLDQLISKLELIAEPSLNDLDAAITAYIQKRAELKRPILEELDEENLNIENLTIANLNTAYNETQKNLIELETMMGRFQKDKDHIQCTNQRALKEFISGQNSCNQGGFMFDLCKGLLIELSKHQDISRIVEEIDRYRRGQENYHKEQYTVELVQKYLGELDLIFRGDQPISGEDSLNSSCLRYNPEDPNIENSACDESIFDWKKSFIRQRAFSGGSDANSSNLDLLLRFVQ